MYIFKATTATSTNVAFSKEVWYTANGTFYTSRIQNRITTGDFDGDGVDEIAAMYYYTDLSMKVFVFNPVENNGTWSMSGSPWYSTGAGTFDSTKVTGRFVAGDFDGDGMDEIAAMYDTGNNSMVTYVFNKNGSGNSLTRETWLTAGEGSFGANFVTGTLVAGNFLGDDKDDLAMIYKYPSCAKVLTYESLGNHFGNWAQRHDGNGTYTFENMQYRVFGGNVDGSGYDEIVAMYRQASRAFSVYKFTNTGEPNLDLNSSVWNSQAIVVDNAAATTTRISSETIGADTYAYTYDVLGNITEIKKNGQTYRRYTYDDLGELIAEEVAGEYRTEYVYDNGGNILSSTKYLYENGAFQSSGETKTYAYSTGAWKDLLTGYDGQSITYDAIGNPTRWAGCDTTWSDGRLLMDIDGEISFEYNSSGIRTKKECDGITHEYLLDGTTILCEKRSDGITLDFYYDESGNIFAMGYDGAMYYHVRNALGEIIGLIDSNGAYVAKYTYDAWGWPETIEDGSGNDVQFNNSHIANINPFRYKGYYFDNEYYLYYLQSRYYDPMACRFINADGTVSTDTGFLGYNMFAYCNNNPVSFFDPTGRMACDAAKEGFIMGFAPPVVKGIGDILKTILCATGIGFLVYEAIEIVDYCTSDSSAGVINNTSITDIPIDRTKEAEIARAQRIQSRAAIKADSIIKHTVKQSSKTRYWSATIRDGYVDIGRPLTYGAAVREVTRGHDVFTVTSVEAFRVAKAAGGRIDPLFHTNSGKPEIGYYEHYHTYDHKYKTGNGAHIFYLF